MKKLASMAVVSTLLAAPGAAGAAPDSFAGTCALHGSPFSAGPGQLSLGGRGQCTGVLNGKLLRGLDTVLAADTTSRGLAYYGSGVLAFSSATGQKWTIFFTINVTGPVLRLNGTDGGLAVISLRPSPLTNPVFAREWDSTTVTVPWIKG